MTCNLQSVEEITKPGIIDDLVADASQHGYQASARLIRDWSHKGLLDYPHKRGAGKGHGSAPALYPAGQRNLLLTLLHHRSSNGISSLARVPVGIWMYWGEDYVRVSQVQRALRTWIGDPRASQREAADAARAILGQVDNPAATTRARRDLQGVLAKAAWTGHPDFAGIERALRAVFEPGAGTVRRVVGHPAAPVMIESMLGVMQARLTAVNALLNGQVTDDMLEQARDAHLFAYAEYAARQPFLAETANGVYEPATAEETLNRSCAHLLSVLGMEITYPEDAARLRAKRTYMRKPTLNTLGLTPPANPEKASSK